MIISMERRIELETRFTCAVRGAGGSSVPICAMSELERRACRYSRGRLICRHG